MFPSIGGFEDKNMRKKFTQIIKEDSLHHLAVKHIHNL